LAVARVFENLLTFAVLSARVSEPEKSIAIDADTVRVHKAGTPRLEHLARCIELDDVWFVAVKRKNAAFFVDRHRRHLTPRDTGRQRAPPIDKFVSLILSVGSRLQNRQGTCNNGEEHHSFHAADYRTHLVAQSVKCGTGSV